MPLSSRIAARDRWMVVLAALDNHDRECQAFLLRLTAWWRPTNARCAEGDWLDRLQFIIWRAWYEARTAVAADD
jgi:hypothetical protein